jgi:Rho-binding antiterminator
MSNPSDYRPISCDAHSEYELAIMHKQKLKLRWGEGNVIHEEVVQPLDLKTQDHEEFLIFKDQQNRECSIRLDRIRHWEAAP